MAKQNSGNSANRPAPQAAAAESTETNTPAPATSGDRVTPSDTHQAIVGLLEQFGGLDAPAASEAGPAKRTGPTKESQDQDDLAATDDNTETEAEGSPPAEVEEDEEQDKEEQTEEGEESGGEDDNLDGELPQGVRKTLHELRDQRRQLREEQERLKAQVADLEEKLGANQNASQPVTNRQDAASGPAAKANTPEQLAAFQREAEDHLEQIEDQIVRVRRNPEAVAQWLKGQGIQLAVDQEGTEDHSPEAVEEVLHRLRRGLTRTINRDVPAQREFLNSRARNNQWAAQEVDWLGKKDSPEMKIIKGIMDREPELLKRPDALRILVRLVEGEKVINAGMRARQKGTQKPTPKPAPSAAGRASNGAPRSHPGQAQLEAAHEALRGKAGKPTAVPLLEQLLNQ